MDSQYQISDEENFADGDHFQSFQPSRKRMTKNQQIYGDFYDAYDPQPQPSIFSQPHSYSQFKPGLTMETYSSQVEVTLPKSKPKLKKSTEMVQEEQQEERPTLGKFTLNSFLSQFGKEQLDDIKEENQESSEGLPEGLNEKILEHMELVKNGEEQTEEQVELENLTFKSYMEMGRPLQQPRYKTEEQKELANDFRTNYGVGFKMMEKMGFKNITKGLGKQETGRHTPVQANFKTAFTMKDDTRSRPPKKQEEERSAEEDKEEKQPAEELFRYHSKNPKINNFLSNLKKDYEKLKTQQHYLEEEIVSMKGRLEITSSTQYQEENRAKQLKDQIIKLEVIGSDIDRCAEYPHLGEHYQIDILSVKKVYDKLQSNDVDFLHKNAERQLGSLRTALFNFYVSKSRESIKMFQQTSAIEQKMHKNISKKHKKREVIDLDNLSEEDEVRVVEIGVEEKEKIKKLIGFILNRSLVPFVEATLSRFDSLDEVKDDRVIDLLKVVQKFDSSQKIAIKIVEAKVIPLYEQYLGRLNFDDFEGEKVKVLPHLVILPWVELLFISNKFNLMNFYKGVARNLWNLELSTLFNIVHPFRRISSAKEQNFFINLCLAPRLLFLLQKFSISSPNPGLLNGFAKYSELLPEETREEILESTLFVEVEEAYRQQVKQKEQEEVAKWLKGWRKFSNKIAPGKFDRYFQSVFRLQ